MSQNTTRYDTMEKLDRDMSKKQKYIDITQNIGELVLGESVLELPIPGEPGNRIIPLR